MTTEFGRQKGFRRTREESPTGCCSRMGHRVTRQSGSHVPLSNDLDPQHHITMPAHDPLRVGTLAAILSDVGGQLQLDRQQLLKLLFG